MCINLFYPPAALDCELVADGEIPAVKIGRSVRVSRKELDRWLEDKSYTHVAEARIYARSIFQKLIPRRTVEGCSGVVNTALPHPLCVRRKSPYLVPGDY
jgi:hypothetical protein